MRGINKVILVGSLGANPLTKHYPNGNTYVQFSIATSEKYQDKNTGDWIENTEWHRIIAYGRLGETATQLLKKGSKVYVEGSLRTRQFTDQRGQQGYITEVRANTFQSLDSLPQANPY
ncbi:TPA: single-stranded DNA-binding protein [Acinetobacter baumannii]|uniref:Single-stranded DNA-binding protein n=1 Tax=Acinetobacter baumannii 625974 TaxID=1310607 RepID=A0A009PIV2_ACIBA|nr:single-stranded DNA-binding protein [Acinetobacter baumannii]EXC09082.1 single-stranded DNA-binding family protein [Acinetobacter baumannii 625974]KAF0616965.1 single-stranded DNA-binding protein [Acinetobacter baumannii]KQK45542.1 single-stranded DNA-binding protein [Acinetobacter baumannii]MBF6739239.1 single-stranded DNA-binding protein [Acinetobacter baumannii]MBF6823613.1 single-stranded DNA-binding protein [Acinetobacter baumannii]